MPDPQNYLYRVQLNAEGNALDFYVYAIDYATAHMKAGLRVVEYSLGSLEGLPERSRKMLVALALNQEVSVKVENVDLVN